MNREEQIKYSDCIERQAAIDEIEERKNANGYSNVSLISELNRLEGYMMRLPSAQPEQRWNRMMMYLADLQLTYSTGLGANGQGDQKLYDFVTGLIEELQGWEEGEEDE